MWTNLCMGLLTLLLLGFSPQCAADWFHKKVSYECRTKDGVLTIKYEGAYN
jgi:hypothetical protein